MCNKLLTSETRCCPSPERMSAFAQSWSFAWVTVNSWEGEAANTTSCFDLGVSGSNGVMETALATLDLQSMRQSSVETPLAVSYTNELAQGKGKTYL